MADQDALEALQRELELTRRDLKRAQTKLKLVELGGRIGLWEADMATDAGKWSPAMYTFYNHDPALDPPGFQSFADFVHPDDHETVQTSTAAMLAQPPGATPPIVFRTHPDRGPVRYLETSLTMVVDHTGGWAAGAVVDVTERERARAQAQVYQDRLAQILDLTSLQLALDRGLHNG